MYENGTTDPRHKAPDPQRATLTPTPPVHHPDTQAPSKRRMMWNPSPALLRLRERAYFPGRYTKSPESLQKQLTMKNYSHLPVNLPPLQLKNKMSQELVSTPGCSTGPDSTKSDGHSDSHLRDYKRSQKCPKQQISPVIPKPSLQLKKTPPHRRHNQPAVRLRPLQSTSQNLVSTPNFSTWLFSLMRDWGRSRRHDLDPFDDSLVHSRDQYLIVSEEMVVLMCDEPVCMSLECWERLCRILPKIIRIPFFAHFKTRRLFSTWRSKVRSKKFNLARNSLKKQLFTLNQCLRPALVDVWKMCIQISDTGLCHIEQKHTYTLWDFQDTQVKQLQKTLTDLKKFQGLVKELTVCACRNYLSPPTQPGSSPELMKLRCLAQIKKSFHLNRVSCFIRLVDYLVASTLHHIAVKAVALVLSALQQRPCQSPGQSQGQPERAESLEAETSGEPPMFTTELVLDTKALTYNPSEDDFQESFSEIFGQMKRAVMAVGTLAEDPDFDPVTELRGDQTLRYSEDSEASHLERILCGDEHLQTLLQSIKASLHSAFHAARVYAHTLEPFRLLFKENQGLDLGLLRQRHHDLTFFEKSLEMLSREQKEAEAVQRSTPLGLLLVDAKGFKDKCASSLRRRLEVLNETLAELARRSLDAVSAEVYEAQFQLKALPPSTTPELANYLSFLDHVKDRMVVFEKEKENVCRLYALITEYSVPVASEDQIAFTQLEPSTNLLRSLVGDALSVRGSTVRDFLTCLERSVTDLSCKLEELKLKLLDPQFLDINSDFLQVTLLLGDIQVSTDELQNLASTYTSYQKTFKVEVSTFGVLEELKVELRLKQLLWESVQEWDSLHSEWRKSKLRQLDVDQIRSQITKYDKHVDQLEEGLPKNSVVSSLKDKMEVVRRTLPVVTELRRLCVDQESWKTLENVLETSLDLETLTLSYLEETDVLSHAKTIQEVTKQLSKTNF